MAPEYTEDQEEGELGKTLMDFIHFFSLAQLFTTNCLFVLTEVQEGWQFRPPPRGVTSSEEYTLCKRYLVVY